MINYNLFWLYVPPYHSLLPHFCWCPFRCAPFKFYYSFTSLYTYIMYFIIIPYYPPLFSPPSTEPLLPKESSVTAWEWVGRELFLWARATPLRMWLLIPYQLLIAYSSPQFLFNITLPCYFLVMYSEFDKDFTKWHKANSPTSFLCFLTRRK